MYGYHEITPFLYSKHEFLNWMVLRYSNVFWDVEEPTVLHSIKNHFLHCMLLCHSKLSWGLENANFHNSIFEFFYHMVYRHSKTFCYPEDTKILYSIFLLVGHMFCYHRLKWCINKINYISDASLRILPLIRWYLWIHQDYIISYFMLELLWILGQPLYSM